MTTSEAKTNLRPNASPNLVAPGAPATTGPRSLAQAVQTAVRTLDGSMLGATTHRDARPAHQPKTLLALLTYCYARQIYGSAEIEEVLRRDANLRAFCPNEFPGAPVIRLFRRDNCQPIRLCLASVLCYLAEQKVKQGIVTKVNKAHLAEEANRRIIMAMFIDATDLDGN